MNQDMRIFSQHSELLRLSACDLQRLAEAAELSRKDFVERVGAINAELAVKIREVFRGKRSSWLTLRTTVGELRALRTVLNLSRRKLTRLNEQEQFKAAYIEDLLLIANAPISSQMVNTTLRILQNALDWPQQVGRLLKQWREDLPATQKELAKPTGLPQYMICKIETGYFKANRPSSKRLLEQRVQRMVRALERLESQRR